MSKVIKRIGFYVIKSPGCLFLFRTLGVEGAFIEVSLVEMGQKQRGGGGGGVS